MGRQRDDKLMDILNDDTQKIPFMYITISCWNVFTINLINQPFKFNKLPKVVKPTNSYKTLGTCLIYKPMSLPPQVEMKLMHSLIYLALISPYVSAFKRVFLHSCHKSSIKKRDLKHIENLGINPPPPPPKKKIVV